MERQGGGEPWKLGTACLLLGVLAAFPLVFTWGWELIDQSFAPSDGPIGLWFFGSIASVVLGAASVVVCGMWSRRAPRPSRSWALPGIGTGLGILSALMSAPYIVWIWQG